MSLRMFSVVWVVTFICNFLKENIFQSIFGEHETTKTKTTVCNRYEISSVKSWANVLHTLSQIL